MKVLRSTDLGKSFKETRSAPAFPKDDGRGLANIWSLEAGEGRKEIWCGVEPAALFRSGDGGDSWEMVPGLSNHPHARQWHPGNGGLCLHTILLDPSNDQRMYIAVSSAGCYRTDDGGKTWAPFNRNVRADFMPNRFPEFGQCVHKMALHPSKPEVLYQQNSGA